MTLREAMLSGNPLRRAGSLDWCLPATHSTASKTLGGKSFWAPFLTKDGEDLYLNWDDILADDWEVQ